MRRVGARLLKPWLCIRQSSLLLYIWSSLGTNFSYMYGAKMAVSRSLAPVLLLCSLFCYIPLSPSSASSDCFVQCLLETVPQQLVYTQTSSSFDSVLVSSIRNPKFFTPDTVRPLCIVTPTDASHVQAAVICGRRNGVLLRVRSGGHDYEGLSYRSVRPELFALVDLNKLRAVRINGYEAWVDSGATLGELYYAIAKANPHLAFPAGECPTIGVGGHFRGGGYGMMARKYGLTVDHVLDATLIDVNGRLLNQSEMGWPLFWAIRGGGSESFGIVVSWKVRLVAVPSTVTMFNIQKTLDQGALDILTKWQEVASALPYDLLIRVIAQKELAVFQAEYLGTCNDLLPVMAAHFPDLGMNRTDCMEMTWLQSVASLGIFTISSDANIESILNRTTSLKTFTKGKSDYVRKAITKDAWERIYSWLAQPGAGVLMLEPYGGEMSKIPEWATPFPHRKGVLYHIQYIAFWTENESTAPSWIRDFYNFMEQFVSNNPREAYLNFRDLDIGENVVVDNVTSYDTGKVWGEKYFMGNFRMLACIKGKVDPDDYFRSEQSIPPLLQCY